jgi:hypothetical protein
MCLEINHGYQPVFVTIDIKNISVITYVINTREFSLQLTQVAKFPPSHPFIPPL